MGTPLMTSQFYGYGNNLNEQTKMGTLQKIAFRALLLLVSSLMTDGTGFQGAAISLEPINSQDEGMLITIQISWQRNSRLGGYCNASTVESGSMIGEENSFLSKSANATVPSMAYYCKGFSIEDNWAFWVLTFKTIFPESQDIGAFTFGGSYWMYPINKEVALEAKLNLSKRKDTGKLNATPKPYLIHPLRLEEGLEHHIPIMVTDAENDTIRCRWPDKHPECGGVCDGFPHAVLDQQTCTITYKAVYGCERRAVAVVVEDFIPGSNTSLSSVGFQFFIEIFSKNNTCSAELYSPIPMFMPATTGSCVTIPPNQNFSLELAGYSGQENINISEVRTEGPKGLEKSILTQLYDGTFRVNITWKPLKDQYNKIHAFCYSAVNLFGRLSDKSCLQLMPNSYPPSIISIHFSRISQSRTQLEVQFNHPVEISSNVSEIVLRDYDTSSVIHSISLWNVTSLFSFDNRNLTIPIEYDLPKNKRFYLQLKENSVHSIAGCKPGNRLIDKKEQYTFTTEDTIPPVVEYTNMPSKTSSSETFKWKIDEPAKSICSLDFEKSMNCSEGIFTANNLTEGKHVLFIKHIDLQNNTVNTTHVFFTDLTPPVTTLLNVPDAVSNIEKFTFTFSCNEPQNNCSYYCNFYATSSGNSANYSLCPGDKFFTPILGNEEEYLFSAFAIDNVGNTGEPSIYKWFVDLKPPNITVMNTSIQCSSYKNVSAETPKVLDNLDPNPNIKFSDELRSCEIVRTWIATDKAGNSAQKEEKITLLFTPFIALLPSLSFSCSSTDGQINIPTNTASAPNPCKRPLLLTYTDSVRKPVCPSKINRTWSLSDTCSGQEVKAQQTIILYDVCPPDSCGQNHSEPRGICSKGSCLCSNSWHGESCNIFIQEPKINPVVIESLLEYQDIEVNLTLSQGTPPVTWNLVTSPDRTQLKYSTGTIFLRRAQAGNLTFVVVVTNQVGEDHLLIKATVNSTYSANLDPLVKDLFPKAEPVTLTGIVKFDTVSPVKEILNGYVPITVDVFNRLSGFHRSLTTYADQDSRFSVTYYPGSLEYGKYEALARHPSEILLNPQIVWNVLGMKTLQTSLSLYGETAGPYRHIYANITTLINDGPEDLNSIVAEQIPKEVLDAGIDLDLTFGNGEKDIVKFSRGSKVSIQIEIKTEGAIQARFPVMLTSLEGVRLLLIVQLDVKQILPVLQTDPKKFDTSVIRGYQKLIEFKVTNIGKTTAKNVSLILPKSSLFTIVSFGIGSRYKSGLSLINQESALASIMITLPSDQPLGIISGSFYIRGEKTNAEISFNIMVTSNYNMNLTIVVEDEYTYFADGNPLVSDATISIRNQRRNIDLVRSTAENNGSATFVDIPEDRFEVYIEAPGHRTKKEIIVTSKADPRIILFLERQAVTVKWSVVPTEVKDVYDIVLEADFKVNVPQPVLSVTPYEVDLEDYRLGLKEFVEFNITNQGLIRADDVNLVLPAHPLLNIIALKSIPGSLAAKQSVIIPVRITYKRRQKRIIPWLVLAGKVIYTYVCSELQTRSILIVFKQKGDSNPTSPTASGIYGVSLQGPGHYGGTLTSDFNFDGFSSTSFNPCNPCVKAVVGCIPIGPKIPVSEKLTKAFKRKKIDLSQGIDPSNCAVLLASKSNPFGNGAGFDPITFLKYLSCLDPGPVGTAMNCYYDLVKECIPKSSSKDTRLMKKAYKQYSKDTPLMESALNYAESAAAVFNNLKALVEVFGDILWLNKGSPEWATNVLLPVFSDTSELGRLISPQEFIGIRNASIPTDVTWEDVKKLLDRFNTTLANWQFGNLEPMDDNKNIISYSQVESALYNISFFNDKAKKRGFSSYIEAYKFDIDQLTKIENTDGEDGVCAIVRIQVRQRATLTREAFIATLEIENKEKNTIEDISVTIAIRDGRTLQEETKKFSIGAPKITGALTGISGSGTLSQDSSGSSEWLIIPYSEAAPTNPVIYDIGGNLEYSAGGANVSIPFVPTIIAVYPDPSLVVRYFWEKYVNSDDPFTDEVEPAVPFSLGVMIKNEGFGTASQLKITSAQPEIIENEKGLLIAFEVIKASLGSEDAKPSLTVDFGDILPNATKTARWWMTSSLIGKFTNYNATFENRNPLGDPKLSLIDNLTIHELIQNVRIPGYEDDGVLDFLVNDVIDPYSTPDKLYSSKDMSSQPVYVGGVVDFQYRVHGEGFLLQLETNTSHVGWYYFTIRDEALDSMPVGTSFKFSRKNDSHFRVSAKDLPRENAWISVNVLSKKREKSLNVLAYTDDNLHRSIYFIEVCKDCIPQNGSASSLASAPFATTPSSSDSVPSTSSVSPSNSEVISSESGTFTSSLSPLGSKTTTSQMLPSGLETTRSTSPKATTSQVLPSGLETTRSTFPKTTTNQVFPSGSETRGSTSPKTTTSQVFPSSLETTRSTSPPATELITTASPPKQTHSSENTDGKERFKRLLRLKVIVKIDQRRF